MSEEQQIKGRLSCAPNARNPRDLDIIIAYQSEGEPEAEIHYKMCVFPSSSIFVAQILHQWNADRLSGPNSYTIPNLYRLCINLAVSVHAMQVLE